MKVGPAALIGLSDDAPSTSHIRHAASEARLALDFASASRRVVQFSQISFRESLLSQAPPSLQASIPTWTQPFAHIDRRARGSLAATLRAYADCDMNVQKAAKQLGLHPNTIYARMQRIVKATGLDPLRFHDLNEMLLVLDCVDRAEMRH